MGAISTVCRPFCLHMLSREATDCLGVASEMSQLVFISLLRLSAYHTSFSSWLLYAFIHVFLSPSCP